MALISDEKVRREAIREAIDLAIVAAFDTNEPMPIWACMAPCVSPPSGQSCPLCEMIWVYPNGIVVRESRLH